MRAARTFVIGASVAFAGIAGLTTTGPTGPVRAASAPPTSFVRLDATGAPARWDPCAPLKWKIAGTGSATRLRRASLAVLRQVRATTGLRFVYAGRATPAEFASPPRGTIVVGATPELGVANAGGITNLFYEQSPTGAVAITGARVAVNPIVVRPGTKWSWMLRPIVLHEIGHAIGLAHVNDSREIMYPQVVRATAYTASARVALAELGSSRGCVAATKTGA